MKLNTLVAARPVLFFFLLALLVLVLPGLLIPCWYKMTQRIQREVALNTYNLHSGMVSEIESVAKLLHPINSSATNLARVISSSVNSSALSFSDVEIEVVPSLFQAFSTTPHISQISYIGLDGLFFSYLIDGDQTLAVYSNSSFPNARKKQMWYTQPVDRTTGDLYGEAIKTSPSSVNTSWFLKALNSTEGSAAIGTGWNKAQELLFLNTASIYGRGAVSLGIPVKKITNFFTDINLYGGRLSIATNQGEVLVNGFPNTQMIVANNSISFQLKNPNNGEHISPVGNVSCMPAGDGTLSIGEIKYKVYCSPLEIGGVKSVYALAMPKKGLVSLVHRTSKLALVLLLLMIAIVVISVFSFVSIIVRGAKKEIHLTASLIKQMEATQQAERKTMNKSLAFASASHDIRASLAGITGFIDICYEEAAPGSDLETNLRQMKGCANDLLSLLNSILDTSKIEAGKMQLETKEFNLGQLLEDIVDLFHPVGMKKGVDVVLDPHDGSVMKFSHVKGDAGKLKQVLSNLLSNAVKFTSEGHVSVRAWVRKPNSSANPIHSSNRNGWLQSLPCLFYKNKKARNDIEAMNAVHKNQNSMEFVFEVDDTGKGIPKDKRKSVFENYVQVKEGQVEGGTGLGLGIVQSLVRVQGGDIEIIDKENDERGTCFRFNIFLTVCETSSSDNTKGDNDSSSWDTGTQLPHMGLTISAPSPGLTFRTPSPRLNILSPSPRLEGSRVVLLIANEERRRAAQNFMEKLGINLSVVNRWENLHSTLRRMKSKFNHSPHSSSGKSDFSSRTDSPGASLKDVPLSAMEGTDYRSPVYKRRGAPNFILIIIDATAGPFSELFNTVTEFRRDLQGICKVVWLDKPTSRSINFDGLDEERMDPNDEVLLKPFHGSRLLKVIKLLPEFGGTSARQRSQRGKSPRDPSSSNSKPSHSRAKSSGSDYQPRGKLNQQAEIQEDHSSSSGQSRKDVISTAPPVQTHFRQETRNSSDQGYGHRRSEIEEEDGETSRQKPLSGKRILVAEDSPILQRVAKINLSHLGATVEVCENGEEALHHVRGGLRDQGDHGGPPTLPYDYILMDCEMPVMNGYEATRQIRKEEKHYGIHIPIIALTAHISGDEADQTILAGMDIHLSKPLNREHLLEAIRYINSK